MCPLSINCPRSHSKKVKDIGFQPSYLNCKITCKKHFSCICLYPFSRVVKLIHPVKYLDFLTNEILDTNKRKSAMVITLKSRWKLCKWMCKDVSESELGLQCKRSMWKVNQNNGSFRNLSIVAVYLKRRDLWNTGEWNRGLTMKTLRRIILDSGTKRRALN